MISDKMHEIAMLNDSIRALQNQLEGLADLRQAAIRKCRDHILDAIFVLEEEKIEINYFSLDQERSAH